MPVQSWGHAHYWVDQTPSTYVPQPPGASRGGYPAWQIASVAPSLLGAIGAWWDAWRTWARAWYRLYQRMEALPASRRAVVLEVLAAVESDPYADAKRAVRVTATTLGFRDPSAWVEYSRAIKGDAKRAENLWRRVRACDLTQAAWSAAHQSTAARLSNPQVNLLVELAYHEYARQPWGDA